MYEVIDIVFEEWEKELPWVKEYENLLAKEVLLPSDCTGFLENKTGAIALHLERANSESSPLDDKAISDKYSQAVNNLVGLLSNPILEFTSLVEEINNRPSTKNDRDLFTDELKERYIAAKEFQDSFEKNPLYSSKSQQLLRRTQGAKQGAESCFMKEKQAAEDRYIAILNQEKRVLQQRVNELFAEEVSLKAGFNDLQMQIYQLKSLTQQDANRLKIEIKVLQPIQKAEPTIRVGFPPSPPPPPPFLNNKLLSTNAASSAKSNSMSNLTTNSDKPALCITDDVLANLKLRSSSKQIVQKKSAAEIQEIQEEPLNQSASARSHFLSRVNSTPVQQSSRVASKRQRRTIEDVEADLSTLATKIIGKEAFNLHLKERNTDYTQIHQRLGELRKVEEGLQKEISLHKEAKQRQLEEEKQRHFLAEQQLVVTKLEVNNPTQLVNHKPSPPPPPPSLPPMFTKNTAPQRQTTMTLKESLVSAKQKKAEQKSTDLNNQDSSTTTNMQQEKTALTKQDHQAALFHALAQRKSSNSGGMPEDKEESAEQREAKKQALEEEQLIREQEKQYRESILTKYKAEVKEEALVSDDILTNFIINKTKVSEETSKLDEDVHELKNQFELLLERISIEKEQIQVPILENKQPSPLKIQTIPSSTDVDSIKQEDKTLLSPTPVEIPTLPEVETKNIEPSQTVVLPIHTELGREPSTPNASQISSRFLENKQPDPAEIQITSNTNVSLIHTEQNGIQKDETPPPTPVERSILPNKVKTKNGASSKTVVSTEELGKVPAIKPTTPNASQISTPFDKLLKRIEGNRDLLTLLQSDPQDKGINRILSSKINHELDRELSNGTISDLLVIRNYVAKKQGEIQSINIDAEEKRQYKKELMDFYQHSISILLSKEKPAIQYKQLRKAAKEDFTHRDSALRFFADILLVLSSLVLVGLIVGGARKYLGNTTFFFSTEATQREKDFKNLPISGSSMQSI